eukprot:gene23757-36852_t
MAAPLGVPPACSGCDAAATGWRVRVDAATASVCRDFDGTAAHAAARPTPLPPLAGLPDDFAVGLVVGPSASGKTRWLRALRSRYGLPAWPAAPVFAPGRAALRPYHVLSNGQQERVRTAAALARSLPAAPAVVDDFAAVVDPVTARSMAAAVGRHVRARGLRRVLVATPSADVCRWLQPCFVVDAATGDVAVNARPAEQRRPQVCVDAAGITGFATGQGWE